LLLPKFGDGIIMALLRGRAASPVRPGAIVKQVLLGEAPLATGELVSEAAITDLHSAYKFALSRYNELRLKSKHIRGMTMHSFYTMFKFAQLLGLVEFVRTEPMQFPPPTGSLYTVQKTDRVRAVKSMRRIFKLSSVGAEDERSWLDLTKAWKEQWSSPQKVEHFPTLAEALAPPVVKEIKEVVEKVKVKAVKPKKIELVPEAPIPSFKWTATPSKRQYTLLLDHLVDLQKLDQTRPDVISHTSSMETRIGDWTVEIEDRRDTAKEGGRLEAADILTQEAVLLSKLFESIIDGDLGRATEAARELVLFKTG